MLLIIPFSE